MTLENFVEKYEGKQVDFDGYYGAQCVDLFRQYCQEVLQVPRTESVIGASDLYTKYNQMPRLKDSFDRIPYKASEKPDAGDVVVFDKTPSNKYGHVAIVLSATQKTMIVFEQDGFQQDKGAYITTRMYKNTLGFLRKKGV